METATQILLLIAAAIRLATPLLLAALAGIYAERSGVIDLSLEGKMLAGAFAGAALASVSGNVWVGALAAMATGILLSLLHGFATVTHRGNQVVAGMAINIAMAGLIPTVAQAIFALGGQTPQLGPAQRFLGLVLPFADGDGLVAQTYARLLSGHNALTWLAFLAVPATGWLLYRTGWGLRLRAVGENPYAVDTAGLPVARLRYQALVVNGALAGLAGAYLSMAANAGFSRDMTAGKGYLAIAALIFGRWAPVPTMLACLLFAFADAVQAQLQTVRILPSQFVGALPYILTVLVLALVGKGGGMPKALGIPYIKERGV
ncbi:MAG: L-arabinose transporter permease protein [Rhodospirillales bacterium]|nr:L-arabinose transporter permease protein [Rhodospirillales bacterium]